ncbi:hypothetical protein [Streptomyces sp. YU58]|uniref:hypothetical protein n=1 Tax=Streptomyces sp. SX92 TaxID=3158972 RepID=UPI0027B8E7A2|nr:hypothetical protein [Streptomyces coralus]WLW53906.1 hypothetical protein QU709_22240 [Streptomyces coralus]
MTTTMRLGQRRGGRALAAAGVAGALALVAVGCGGSEGYAVPDRVCGVPVDADTLSPLLPDGEKLTENHRDKGPGSESCRVTVDDTLVLYLAGDITDRGTDAVSLADRGLRRLGEPALVQGVGDRAAVADGGAKAMASCTYEGEPRQFVGLVQLESDAPVPAETAERRDALLAFLKSWFPAAGKAQGCAP